jgi:antitoxin component YwqK of YwqJK toxin-antitoxin module
MKIKVNTLVLIFFLSAATTALYAQNLQTVKTYYDPRTKIQLEEVFTVIVNTPTKQGLYKKYDEQGTLIEERNFSKGELNGLSKTYYGAFLSQVYDNPKDWYGKIAQIANYSNGLLNGSCEEFKYSNGKQQYSFQRVYDKGNVVKNIEFYSNGNKSLSSQMNGICNEWLENGQKSAEYTRKNGELDGQYTWYENENVMITGTYSGGNKIGKWIEYFSNRKVKSENLFNENFVCTNIKEYYPDGSIKYEYFPALENHYKEIGYDSLTKNKSYERISLLVTEKQKTKLVKDGEEIYYYPNGDKKSDVTYSAKYENSGYSNHYEAKKEGEYIEWYANKQIKSKGSYISNYENGIWITYYESGNKESEISYDNSSKEGEATTYYSNGKIKSQGKYKGNKKVGLWIYNKENGEADYYENDGKKYTKAEYEEKTASKEYYANKAAIDKKLYEVISLYSCKKESGVVTGRVSYNRIEFVDMVRGEQTTYIPSKKINLFNGFAILYNSLNGKISVYSPMIGNVKYQTQLIALLDKMTILINTDTKDMEKQLKKEVDSEKIKTILGI